MTAEFDWSQFQEESPKSEAKDFDWNQFEEEKQGPSRTRSLISAPVKGVVKGASELAAMRDPVAALFGLNDLTPIQKKVIDKLLPTQEEPLERGLERAGRLGVSAIGGPETLLAKGARVGAGALLGQTAEEAGAPEWLQNIGELAAFISPKFGKDLLPTKSQAESVAFLRGKGLSDKQITPLIQTEKKIRVLSKFADKGKKTETVLKDITGKLGENYEILKQKGANLPESFLRGTEAVDFSDSLEKVLDKINPRFKRLIQPDVDSLMNKGISTENLMNFYQDINAVVKGHEGGKAVLGIIKKPLLEGMKKLSPEIADDFSKLNHFYSKKAQLAKGLKKGIIEKMFTGGKILATIGSIATGNFGFLPKIIGGQAAQIVARELLINPRLQNISNQMLKSIAENKIPVALKLLKQFRDNLQDQEAQEELDKLD